MTAMRTNLIWSRPRAPRREETKSRRTYAGQVVEDSDDRSFIVIAGAPIAPSSMARFTPGSYRFGSSRARRSGHHRTGDH